MSKNYKQVNRYLTQCRFMESDWKLVLDFCKSHGWVGRKAAHPKSDSTFEQFMEWYENGVGSGDIACYKNLPVLVSAWTPSYCVIAATVSLECDSLNTIPKRISNPDDVRPITGQDLGISVIKFKKLLRSSELRFDVSISDFTVSYNFKPYEVIRITKYIFADNSCPLVDGVTYYGAAEKNKKKTPMLFIVSESEMAKQTTLSLNDIVVNKLTNTDRKTVERLLKDNGLEYDQQERRLKLLAERAGYGEKYWYLTDTFSVTQCRDLRTAIHDARYSRGNYFLDMGDALKLMEKVEKLISEIKR